MGYHADIYDAVTPASVLGDLGWYRAVAKRCGGPVLELGAGTGRITLAIAEDGTSIHALDASEEMLAALTTKLAAREAAVQRRVHLHQDDMRTFDLNERFALVIVPYRAFLHNLTEADQIACLTQIRRHLRPGGTLALNVFHPSLEFMAQHAGNGANVWRLAAIHDLPGGAFVMRSDAIRFDTVRRLVHAHHRYEEYAADATLTRSALHRLTLAYLYEQDIRRLLTQVGFERITINGGFEGRPFSNDRDELVVEAQ